LTAPTAVRAWNIGWVHTDLGPSVTQLRSRLEWVMEQCLVESQVASSKAIANIQGCEEMQEHGFGRHDSDDLSLSENTVDNDNVGTQKGIC